MPNYSTPVAPAQVSVKERRKALGQWSKRQTLGFIIVFNMVGWTAAWLVLRPH
ncbi:MAG: hypothetical protein JWP92_2558 [Caulobacter sp.]|nr:hypothetical protein [Caulobacter sp.]